MKSIIFFLLLASCFSCQKSEANGCTESTLHMSQYIETDFQNDVLKIRILANPAFSVCDPEGLKLVSTDCGEFDFYILEFEGEDLIYTYMPTPEDLANCFGDFVLRARIEEP